ncbi:MAG: AAA family ATPase [Collinsella sp.]
MQENLAFTSHFGPSADRFDLTGLKNTPVSRLSDGNRQLLNVAMAYMSYCEVVLLDEPMNALDVRHVAIVSNALRDEAGRGAHVIISSHLIGNLESLCDASVLLTGDDSRVVTREMGGDSKWIGNVYAQLFKTNDSKTRKGR